jgi:hypothetical protein
VKKAGDLLGLIFDNNMMGKAREYSRLFSTWAHLTAKHGIAAASDHSRIQDIRLQVLIVEADHPGWIQILQTREHKLLEDLQASFPELNINGIAFRLSKDRPELGGEPISDKEPVDAGGMPDTIGTCNVDADKAEMPGENLAAAEGASLPGAASAFDNIKDEALKQKLKSLEESINTRAEKKE